MTGKFITEPHRSTPVLAEVDVLVAGGGPAGLAAAISAARSGARTMLVEKHGCLGGMMTAGGVQNIRQYTDKTRLIVGGIAAELARLIKQAGGTRQEVDEGLWVRQDPEITKIVAQELAMEAGVQPLLQASVVDAVVEDGRLAAAIVETRGGRFAITCRCAVDATGDGDLIAASKADFHKADELQPMTLTFVMGNVASWPDVSPGDMKQLVKAALDAGEFPSPKAPSLFPMMRQGYVYANATRVSGDATDPLSLTAAEIAARRQVAGLMKWLQANVPAFKEAFLVTTGMQIGLRETRRLEGLYTMTREDVMEYREFPDNIARGAYAIDIHSQGRTAEMTWLAEGRSYGIPYRSLVPARLNGLLASGRCISATRDALGSTRVMAICMAIGQAAGLAAATSAKTATAPRDLDVPALQQALRDQGQILE